MIDAHKLIRDYLITVEGVTDLTGTGRIWAGRDYPAVGYKPSDGNAIVFKVRDQAPDYDDAVMIVPIQTKCYGTSAIDATTCYRALYDALQNAATSTILHAESDGGGYPLEEPDTGWNFVPAYFLVVLKQ